MRRGGRSSYPPACKEFYLNNRRRTDEPALCKGRCRAERGGGVVPDTNYLFLFCSAKSKLLQSLRRCRASSLYRGTFWFVRTLREYTLLLARATIGRPFCVNLNSVGGHSICPRCVGFHPNNRRREQAPALRGTKRKFQTAGGVSPPGGGVCAPG